MSAGPRRSGLALAVAVALGAGGGTAVAADWEVDGGAALRETALILHGPDAPRLPGGWSGIAETRLRPHGTVWFPHGSAGLALEGRAGLRSANLGGLAGGAGGGAGGASFLGRARPMRIVDLSATAVDAAGVTLSGWVDRADVALRAGPVDILVGRQPISLGTSHFLGILDVVGPLSPGDLDATYKPGVDAVRLRTGFGVAGEAELNLVGADDPADFAAIGRVRFMAAGLDVELLGGRFRQRFFGGLGWEGEIPGQLNLWGEAALFQRRGEPHFGGWSKAAFGGVAGAEYLLPGDVLVGAGGGFNDFGARQADQLLAVYASAPVNEGWMFLAGAAHGLLTVHHQFHPLVTGDLAAIVNLNDGSTLTQPRLMVSVADNAELVAFGWISSGRGATAGPTFAGTPLPRLNSEFGTLPDGGGLYARWFF